MYMTTRYKKNVQDFLDIHYLYTTMYFFTYNLNNCEKRR